MSASNRSRQSGSSLIGVMVGLLVSTMVILGMLSVFRNTIQAVVPASEAARSEGERVTGLLTAHMMLNDAGFGIDVNPANDLVALGTDAQLAAGTLTGQRLDPAVGINRRALVWSKSVNGTALCEGLLADANGGLLRLSSTEECPSAGARWNQAGFWTATALVRESRTRIADDAGDPVRVLRLDVLPGPCAPLGVGGAGGVGGNLSVLISYDVTVDGVVRTVTGSTCLVNFKS